MELSNNQQAFLALVRAGLWEMDACLKQYEDIDFQEIYRLAQEQSVVGLLAAGLERIKDIKVPQEYALNIAGEVLQLEQRNKAMNSFIGATVDKMREAGIITLLVKGQGIAQCYERPLWRACGDVDFFLDEKNFRKAQPFLCSLASSYEPELKEEKHQEFVIGPWVVEIHGNLPCHFSKIVDKVLEEVQEDTFRNKHLKEWNNNGTVVYLPCPDNDLLFVFTHLLKHYFRGGIGLRQVCDWCRLIWFNYKDLNSTLLEHRLRKMGLISEWRAFSTLAVMYLGYPTEMMPLYSTEKKWERKASRILGFIFHTGNFGHNRDSNYYGKYPLLIRKAISFKWRMGDNFRYFTVFPVDSFRVLWWLIRHSIIDFKDEIR